MNKLLILILALPMWALAQPCDVNGNVVVFSNYDGGELNIVVDVNIPNLKIGICSYEPVTVNLSGPFVGNVTEVEYAGYNDNNNNNHCGLNISTTTINGAPAGVTPNIVQYPPATLNNPNGYGSIICAYSCNTGSSQGGCNTVDQVEFYFENLFSGVLYSHTVQYGCWCGAQLLSNVNCCGAMLSTAISTTPTFTNTSCGNCDGTASVTDVSSYTYSWSPGGMTTATVNGLCPGTYDVTVTDNCGNSEIHSVTIVEDCTGNPICDGDTISESTSGYTTTAGYEQLYVLVEVASGNIIATNTTGVFTQADYGAGNIGDFEVYAVNTNDATVISDMNGTGSWSAAEATALTSCAAILGPITYTIENCCDLDVSTVVTDELCDGADDGAIEFTLTGSGIYDILIDSGVEFDDVTSGTFNWDNQSDGTYAIQVVDANNPSCDTTFDITINPGTVIDPTITGVGPFCSSDAAVTLDAVDNGGVWSGNGIVDVANGTFDPATAGTGNHEIIYTISGTCSNADTIYIDVVAQDDASFSFGTNVFCVNDANPLANITGVSGGTFSISPTGTIDNASGELDIASTGQGTFTVSYITNGTCPDTATFDITITDQISVAVDDAGPFCEDDAAQLLNASVTGGEWSGAGVNSSTGEFTPAVAGIGSHQIIYTVPGSCGDADTIDVVVNALPTVDAGNDETILLDESIVLNANGAASYVWTPATGLSCDDCPSPEASPSTTITYTVIGTDANGCFSEDMITITVNEEPRDLFIPNMFSPNGDNNNDAFVIEGTGLNEFDLKVFNRWGELMFNSTDQSLSWDGTHNGKTLNTAVFAYVLSYVDDTGAQQVISGNVTLIK